MILHYKERTALFHDLCTMKIQTGLWSPHHTSLQLQRIQCSSATESLLSCISPVFRIQSHNGYPHPHNLFPPLFKLNHTQPHFLSSLSDLFALWRGSGVKFACIPYYCPRGAIYKSGRNVDSISKTSPRFQSDFVRESLRSYNIDSF